jgi:hypothetical protein
MDAIPGLPGVFCLPVQWCLLGPAVCRVQGLVLLHRGRKAPDTLDDLFAFDYDHLGEQRFGALGGAAAQVTLTALGAQQFARARQAESFRCCLMGL